MTGPIEQVTLEPGRVRRIIRLFHTGRVEILRAFLADDIVWRVPHTHPLAADIIGVDAVLAFLSRVRAETGGTLRAAPAEIAISGPVIFCQMRVTACRGTRRLDQNVVTLWRIRDGKISERDLFMEDTAAADEFWSF